MADAYTPSSPYLSPAENGGRDSRSPSPADGASPEPEWYEASQVEPEDSSSPVFSSFSGSDSGSCSQLATPKDDESPPHYDAEFILEYLAATTVPTPDGGLRSLDTVTSSTSEACDTSLLKSVYGDMSTRTVKDDKDKGHVVNAEEDDDWVVDAEEDDDSDSDSDSDSDDDMDIDSDDPSDWMPEDDGMDMKTEGVGRLRIRKITGSFEKTKEGEGIKEGEEIREGDDSSTATENASEAEEVFVPSGLDKGKGRADPELTPRHSPVYPPELIPLFEDAYILGYMPPLPDTNWAAYGMPDPSLYAPSFFPDYVEPLPMPFDMGSSFPVPAIPPAGPFEPWIECTQQDENTIVTDVRQPDVIAVLKPLDCSRDEIELKMGHTLLSIGRVQGLVDVHIDNCRVCE